MLRLIILHALSVAVTCFRTIGFNSALHRGRNPNVPIFELRASDDEIVDVVNQWRTVVKDATKDAAWYCSGQVFPPLLNINNLLLQYPVNTTGIDLIKSVATVAPFGLGNETIIDEKVRKGLQVEPQTVKFLFEASWQRRLDTITAELCRAYQEYNINLVFYKMLLYEEGGHFSAHKDTLRDKSHIASLLISLPVADGSEGGVLTVKDTASNIEIIWDGQCDDLEGSWCSFYTDCIHELSPLTKDKRIVLAYEVHSLLNKANADGESRLETQVEDPVNGTNVPVAHHINSSLCDVIDSGLAIKDNVLILLDHMYPTGAAKDLKGFDRTLYEVVHNKYGNKAGSINDTFEVSIEEFLVSGDTYGPDKYTGRGGESGFDWFCYLYLQQNEISRLSNSIYRPLPSTYNEDKEKADNEDEGENEEEYEDNNEEVDEEEHLRTHHCYFNPDKYLCLFHSDDISCRDNFHYQYVRYHGNYNAGELAYKTFVIRVSKKQV